jgi:outer membrane protein
MKKQVLAAALVASMSMPAMADFLGVYAGLDYSTNETKFRGDSDSADNFSGYVAFEHFIPLIPNVKLQYSDLSNHHFRGDDSSIKNAMFYYELFDNDIVALDLGLAYSGVKGFDDSASLVQAYGAAKVYVPGSSLHAFTEVLAGTVTNDDLLSAELGLGYTFNPDSVLMNVAVRGGYRLQALDLSDSDSTQKVNGLFAGVEVHF